MATETHRGACLCGAVRFTVTGALPPADACHCTRCRKHSGHYFVSSDVPRDAIAIEGAENVGWFSSSEKARRGFCKSCGSSLFFDAPLADWIGVALGAFDGATGTSIHEHIFVADKGDYYVLGDDVPQHVSVPGR